MTPSRIVTLLFLATLDVNLLGCSFDTKEGAGLAGTGVAPIPRGTDAGVAPNRTYTNGGGSTAGGGGACGSNTFTANHLPPDLLIVLDRSGSMNDDATGMSCVGGCGATSKWNQMTSAINLVVANTEAKVRWGLKLFASGAELCNVNAAAEVPIGPMNAAAIKAAIGGAIPGSATPTRAAETQAAAYLAGVSDPNPKYILLATDGLPNCQQGGSPLAADDAAAIAAVSTVAGMGIPTFVIGVATGGSTADGTLNMMAVNGGHPRSSSPQYYPVSTSQDLESALTVIQGMVALPCQFQLGGVPSDLGAVSVAVDGQVIARSDWTYGPGNRSIMFPDAGAVCGNLKSGAAKDVTISLPCGETVVP
jgi:hypothetical protein